MLDSEGGGHGLTLWRGERFDAINARRAFALVILRYLPNGELLGRPRPEQ
jgi:hypothetical protein